MFQLNNLLPTKKEGRRLLVGVTTGLIVAAIVGLVGLTVPAVRVWLRACVAHIWAFGAAHILVRGWVLVVLAIAAFVAFVQIVCWITSTFRSPHVRLFHSLSRDEQLVVRLLARSDYGLTEGELFKLVPVSERFLYLIDRLVHQLGLVDRTEPSSGGAFWNFTAKGRELAAANDLFRRLNGE